MSLNRIIQAYYIKKTVLLLEQLSVVQNREVVIWGTGNFGKFALELLNKIEPQCKVVGFCDSFFDDNLSEENCGIKVYSPIKVTRDFPNAVYIIAAEASRQILNSIASSSYSFIKTIVLDRYLIHYKKSIFDTLKVIQYDNLSKSYLLKPLFERSVNLVLSSDDNYSRHLYACLNSIISNSSQETNYDICILDGGVSERNKTKIYSMQQQNISIRFVDIRPYASEFGDNIFNIYEGRISIASYYRLFIEKIFHEYAKVLYLDVDMIVKCDVKQVFDIDIYDYIIAAVRDVPCINDCYKSKSSKEYFEKTLGLSSCDDYVNAGLLLINLDNWRKYNVQDRLIEKLKELKTPRWDDQCLINSVCNGKIKYISQIYNFQTSVIAFDKSYFCSTENQYIKEYFSAFDNPMIIHYSADEKPWNNPNMLLAYEYYKYLKNW